MSDADQQYWDPDSRPDLPGYKEFAEKKIRKAELREWQEWVKTQPYPDEDSHH